MKKAADDENSSKTIIAGIDSLKSPLDLKPAYKPLGTLEDILRQRYQQRERIFNIAICLTVGSFSFLILLVIAQVLVNLFGEPQSQILDPKSFAVLALGIFGQIISIIVVISRSVWDDKNYVESLHELTLRDGTRKDLNAD